MEVESHEVGNPLQTLSTLRGAPHLNFGLPSSLAMAALKLNAIRSNPSIQADCLVLSFLNCRTVRTTGTYLHLHGLDDRKAIASKCGCARTSVAPTER